MPLIRRRWFGRIMSRRLTLCLTPLCPEIFVRHGVDFGASFILDRDADFDNGWIETRWESFMRLHGRPFILWICNGTLFGREFRRHMTAIHIDALAE